MKRIKFDLPIDGTKVSSIEELQEHFVAEIIDHFRSGLLERWLESRGDSRFLAEVRELASDEGARSDDAFALRELCRIFKIEADKVAIEAAVTKPTGLPGTPLRIRNEFLDWFLATTHYLSRLVSPRSGFPDSRRAHLGFGLPDTPISTDPDEWSAYVVEYVNHCRVVVEVLKSCPDRAFAEKLASHISDHVDRVLDGIDGMTTEEFDGVAMEDHFEDARPLIRMEPARHDIRTPSRTRMTYLRWTSEGSIEKAGSVDQWCFTVLHPGRVTIQTKQRKGEMSIRGTLEDCYGTVISEGGQYSNDFANLKIVCNINPGTYYVRVSARSATFYSATGDYTLDIRHDTRYVRIYSRDDPGFSTAQLVAVNRSISQARAIAVKHRQEVLRSLSKEHLRALGRLDVANRPKRRRRSKSEWKVALEAFEDALRGCGAQVLRRISDTGLPASGADMERHDDT